MADIFVHILLQKLRELMKSEHPVISSKKNQRATESLYADFNLLSSFLQKTEEKKCSATAAVVDVDDDEKVNNLVSQIRELAHEAENFIDYFVTHAILVDRGVTASSSLSLRWKTLKQHLDSIKIEVDQMNAKFHLHGKTKKIDKSPTTTAKTSPPPGNSSSSSAGEKLQNIVGIDDVTDNILAGLEGEAKMEVLTVVGLPGIGKTTLARKVFDHGLTRSSFQLRAWVTVSQTYSTRQLLMDILHSSSLFEDGDQDSTADKLGENLLKRLKDKKYLIVLDDIWSIKAWDSIQRSFPDQENGSRVLFTSRSTTIGKDLCRDINTHNVAGLSEEESWNLLKNTVFGFGRNQTSCPPNLEKLGITIAKKCDGLPLAIVVIGGLLSKMDKTPKAWKQVARSLRPALATDREAYMDTIALSYQHLPPHLKLCFLYIGAFPEDYEIPVRSLIWLLVAEGLVIQETDAVKISSLEVIIDGYVNDLVERSLVIIASKRSCGATKTVRVHDLLRDFCVVKGKQEKLIAELIDIDDSFDTIRAQHRCLYVHDQALNPLLCGSATLNLRLLLHVSDHSLDRDSSNSVVDFYPDRFRLLAVLELLKYPIKCNDDIGILVHLKYLAVSFAHDVKILPSSIAKLKNLETLILSTATSKVFVIPDTIWYIGKLRHLLNKGGIFHFEYNPDFEKKRSLAEIPWYKHPRLEDLRSEPVLRNLQTLSPVCVCASCIKLLLERTPNLRKLGLSGNLIPASGGSTIPDLGFLVQLENLKLINKKWYSHMHGKLPVTLRKLTSLKKLTLQNTLFKWEQISVLTELENLEVLKLLDNACSRSNGHSEWDTSELEFPKLKYLKMRRLDIVKWDDPSSNGEQKFQSLEVLVLELCRRLETIPFSLACSQLHTIEVTRCNTSLQMLAKEIEQEHEDQCGDNNLRVFITP